ncbi:MAG TPA: O-antigen ligase family protein [Myxococcota bacterium]|nr:O-antigen ligase family protein [Myxococcota bacterium]HRY96157.1 O-antigen ligase family protein [Myxococcota bacterium]
MSSPAPPALRRGAAWLAVALAWSLPVSLFGMQAAAIAGGLLVLWGVARHRGAALEPSPLDLPMLALLAAYGLSLLLAPRPPTSLQTATSFWVMSACLVARAGLTRSVDLRRALVGLLGLASLAGLFGLFQCLTGLYPGAGWLHPQVAAPLQPAPGAPGLSGAVGLFFSRLTFAHALLFPLCWSVALCLWPPTPRWRWPCALAALASAAGLGASFTRAAWVAGALALMGLGLARLRAGRSRRWALGAAAALLLAGAAALPFLPARLTSAFAGSHDWGRLALWHTALDLAAERPLTGVGYGNFQRDAAERIEARRVEVGARRFPGTIAWAHSHGLTFLAETGLLGLAAWVWLFVAYFRAARARLRAGAGGDPLRAAFLRGSLAAVAAFLVIGLAHDAFFDGEVAFALWFCLGASLAGGRAGEGAC